MGGDAGLLAMEATMTDGRSRSPSYPSTPLPEAVEMIKKIHQQERSNPIDREVAAKALGYSGISGRSATVLSNLSQYGLLEKAGKSEIRVSARAVEILYPDDEKSKATALWEAAQEPELFQRILERFTDGRPSRNALEAFLVKEGFTHGAIPSAIRAFQETFAWVENTIVSESHRPSSQSAVESQSTQSVERGEANMTTTGRAAQPTNTEQAEGGPAFHFARSKIELSGVISSQEEADHLITALKALRPMLKASPAEPDPSDDEKEQ